MQTPYIKHGIFYGLFSIILTLVIYLVDPTIFGEFWFSFLMMPIPIIFMVLAVRDEKRADDGYILFGNAFLQSLGVVIIGYLISGVFSYLLYNFIDPGLEDVIKGSIIENMESFEDMMPEEAYEKMIEDMENRHFADLKSIGLGLVSMIMIGGIFALIIAAIMKKERKGIDTLDSNV